MAGVDTGSSEKGKRPLNAEINMIPFIDLLMVTVAFLLITAVWVTNSRINTNAQVPGSTDENIISEPYATLDVRVNEDDIILAWKLDKTVQSERRIPRSASSADLAAAFTEEWNLRGGHKDPSDLRVDQAVLHSDDKLPFRDLVAVMDGLYAPKRAMSYGQRETQVPVFNATFAVR